VYGYWAFLQRDKDRSSKMITISVSSSFSSSDNDDGDISWRALVNFSAAVEIVWTFRPVGLAQRSAHTNDRQLAKRCSHER